MDASELILSERQDVEIDYCPACRGVWLDRGELDKIIERTGSDSRSSRGDRGRDRDDDDDEGGGIGGFLRNLFE